MISLNGLGHTIDSVGPHMNDNKLVAIQKGLMSLINMGRVKTWQCWCSGK